MVRYVLEVDKDITIKQIEVEASKHMQGGDVMRSVVSRIAPEAYQNGVQAGIEKGMEKGRGEGASSVLVSLLNAKFGTLSEKNSLKIRSIQDVGTINGLCMNLLSVGSIDEFMAIVDKVMGR